MDIKLKTNNKEEINDSIGKGFIISVLAIIITSVMLSFYVTKVLDERAKSNIYFKNGSFINSIGTHGNYNSFDRIAKEFNINKLRVDREGSIKKINEDLKKDLATEEENYNEIINNINIEEQIKFENVKKEFNIPIEEDLNKLKNQLDEKIINSDSETIDYNYASKLRGELESIILEFNEKREREKYSYEATISRLNSEANDLKERVNNKSEGLKRSYGDSYLGYDYKIESNDGKAELYNNSNIEFLQNDILYLEVYFAESIDDFKTENVTYKIERHLMDKLIDRIKGEMAGELKNAKMTFSVNEKHYAVNTMGYNEKFIYEALYNLDYIIISGIIILVLFLLAMVTPYKGHNLLVKLYCKLYLEFKVALIITLAMGTSMLVIISKNNLAFFILFTTITTLAILTGRYFRYVAEIGFVKGFLRNFLFIDILFMICKGIKGSFKRNFNGEEKRLSSSKGKIGKERKTLNLDKLDFSSVENKTKETKNAIENYLKSKEASKRLAIYMFLALGAYMINLFFIYVYALNYEFGLMIISILTLLIIPIFFYFISKNFFKQLEEIERASKSIARGDFNINLKDGKSNSLNEISRNLNNINKGFKSAVQDELKSEKMKAELITNVSHDLKTPLTSIINYVDLLQKHNLTELQKEEYLGILENKSKRLKMLVEDLSEATKASSGKINLNLETVDLVSVLKKSLKEFKEKIEESNLDFKVVIPKEEILLELDVARTIRVFDNLIGNALKYSMKNSRVYVKMFKLDNVVKFQIKNVSAYELNCAPEELRERFKRGDASRHTEGSGLGLSIANSLVEIQGAKLDIDIDGDLFTVEVSFFL